MKQECNQLRTKKMDTSNEEILMDIKRSIDEIKQLQMNTVPWNIRGIVPDVLLFH